MSAFAYRATSPRRDNAQPTVLSALTVSDFSCCYPRPGLPPNSLSSHLDQHVIGQGIAKRRIALGDSNHFNRLVDTWDRGGLRRVGFDQVFENRQASVDGLSRQVKPGKISKPSG